MDADIKEDAGEKWQNGNLGRILPKSRSSRRFSKRGESGQSAFGVLVGDPHERGVDRVLHLGLHNEPEVENLEVRSGGTKSAKFSRPGARSRSPWAQSP